MIVDFTNQEFKARLPNFFLKEGGPSFLKEQGFNILPSIANLSKFFNSTILSSVEEGLVLGWIEDNKIVGMMFADVNLSKEYSMKPKVVSGCFTYVNPDHRRKGIAAALRQEMFLRLSEKGYEQVMVQIKEDNKDSLESLHRFKDFKRKEYVSWMVSLKGF